MGEMRKFRVGDTLEGIPVDTLNAHTDAVLAQRTRIGTLPDERKPKQKSPVVVQVVWSTGSDLPAGSCVKLGDAVFDPDTTTGAEFSGITFYVEEFGATDIGSPYAVTLGPLTDGSGTPTAGMAFIPNCTWAKVNVIDSYHKYAQPTPSDHLFQSGWAGLRILWKQSGTGEKWAIVQTARNPLHVQLGVVTDIVSSRSVTGYGGTADATFSLGNFPIVKLLLLDVGNEFDVSTTDLPVLDAGASGMPTSGKVWAYDVRKEGTPKVGDVVRVWASDGEHVAPGENLHDSGTSELNGWHYVYCDPLNVGDYLRGLSTYNVANYQVLVHQDASANLEWANVTDVVTEGGGGGGGSGTVTSVSAGYAIDISGTATDPIVDFDPTELTSFSAAFQFFRHISSDVNASGANSPHWKTISSFDATKNQMLWHQSDAWSFKTTDDYDATKNQIFWHQSGVWQWETCTGYNGAAKQLLGHDNGAWAFKADTRPTAVTVDTTGASLRVTLTLADGTSINGTLAIASLLNALAGYVAGNDQSIGHDASGSTEWQDDGACS